MVTLEMNLEHLDWQTVLAGARAGGSSDGPSWIRAEMASLAALFVPDYTTARVGVAHAQRLDPLNPVHRLRQALVELRFGLCDDAVETCSALEEVLGESAMASFVKALATLRAGDPRRAANIADRAVEARPPFRLAEFLKAEALSVERFMGVKAQLARLPRGPDWDAAWCDLLAKLVVARHPEAQALAAEQLSRGAPGRGSRAAELLSWLTAMAGAGPDELERAVGEQPDGSRAEELVLVLLHDRLRAGEDPRAALPALRRLVDRYPERRAPRRLLVAVLTRVAVAEAAAECYGEALKLVEAALRREPHETAHHQNRAALFTLMRHAAQYHEAWTDLNRHYDRLMLAGRLGVQDALVLVKMHRLFAAQARLGTVMPGARRREGGIFCVDPEGEAAGKEPIVRVNQKQIASDPELLRQWIHHRRAELLFRHWALGPDPDRFLLHPPDSRTKSERLGSLTAHAAALEVLVAGEGEALAQRMTRVWGRLADDWMPQYTPPAEDPECEALWAEHLETLGDLTLLALSWRPDPCRPALVDELFEFLRAEVAFLDGPRLRAAAKSSQEPSGFAMRLLANWAADLFEVDLVPEVLDAARRERVAGRLASELLVRLGFATYENRAGSRDAADRTLAFLDRARELAPDDPTLELYACDFLMLGGYYEEARQAVSAFYKKNGRRDPEDAAKIEDRLRILNEKVREGVKGERRVGAVSIDEAEAPSDEWIAQQQEIERFPASVAAYEELARMLMARCQFAEATAWAERAMASCLGRDGQLRARALLLEVRGLEDLAQHDAEAPGLYLAGAFARVLEALEARFPGADEPYAVAYLRGHCLLALGRPEEALDAFQRALASCDRGLLRTVLRGLTADIDQPYLVKARRRIQDLVNAKDGAGALAAAAAMLGRLRRPAAGLIDLARIHAAVAAEALGTAAPPLPVPDWSPLGPLAGPLDEAYTAGSDLGRARRLAELSLGLDPAARREAEAVLQRVEALEVLAVCLESLNRSNERLRAGQIDEALAVLDEAGPAGTGDPRVLRQRALLLLRLERFDEADETAAALDKQTGPAAREFSERYPGLALKGRLGASARRLRLGDLEGAWEVLQGARVGDATEAIELAYSRSSCRAMAGFRYRRDGRADEARRVLGEALDLIEPHLAAARRAGLSRVVELYDVVERELERP